MGPRAEASPTDDNECCVDTTLGVEVAVGGGLDVSRDGDVPAGEDRLGTHPEVGRTGITEQGNTGKDQTALLGDRPGRHVQFEPSS